ncbi:ATP-binding cassette domain-containing protein [Sphingomonas suaedae]|uniref:ATP-binding cassette domain-containing protein n=2 Tax=Sphingomonas suaedae TaxID=2599297 RepID=A0A518RB83_9SPHN|nr:ATP-binding cassette domain-containing protein [Sphingomonas suaedae]
MVRLKRVGSTIANIPWALAAVRRRPLVEPQSELADCGYVAISAVLARFGRPTTLVEIKNRLGTTSRGLDLRQVRDGIRSFGYAADVIFFDTARPESYPTPGALLLKQGHYVVLESRRGSRFNVYDPQTGWSFRTHASLKRLSHGFGILVDASAPSKVSANCRTQHAPRLGAHWKMSSASVSRLLTLFGVSQIMALALPLISMQLIDNSASLGAASFGYKVLIGYAVITIASLFATFFAEVTDWKARKTLLGLGTRHAAAAIIAKPAPWFENNSSTAIAGKVRAMNSYLINQVEAYRSFGTAIVSFVAGVLVLTLTSPWLAVPSLCSLAVISLFGLLFSDLQRANLATVVETSQRRENFLMETLAQIPTIRRSASPARAKARFVALSKSATLAEGKGQVIRGWKAATTNLLKSAETLIFVSWAAALMGEGRYTIGAFVALGVYKDLFTSSVGSLIHLKFQQREARTHVLRCLDLIPHAPSDPPATVSVDKGFISLNSVSFSYGSLDRVILDRISLDAEPGQCVLIRGASGSGKSTLAKILVGLHRPNSGVITVDGQPFTGSAIGMDAVLQSDRLISGSIRDNIVFYRNNLSDEDIGEALQLVELQEFVKSLPMGILTPVSEKTVGMSGGQRQRILLARAIIGDPKILVLDEATASLSVDMEDRILNRIKRASRTLVVISHRPEVWKHADRTYVMREDGSIESQSITPNPGVSEFDTDTADVACAPGK